MTRRLSIAALLASALTACQLGGETTTSVASDACKPVGAACDSDQGCCSYGCQGNVCVANPLPGGMCRTTDDCGYAQTGTYPYVTTTKMTCKSGACTTADVCRDDADVCTGYDADLLCCAGNCMGNGHCGPNHAPVIDLGTDRPVPYHKLVTLTPVTATDPDGDSLVYGWTLLRPANSLAVLSSATAAVPTFTPDVVGDYKITVVVTDGVAPRPNRMTATSTVTLHAVNTPPVVNAGPDVAHASRNVVQTLAGTFSDPDGDPLTCTWKVKSPAGVEQVVAGPTTCLTSFNGTFKPPIDLASEGAWTGTLEVTDGVNTVADSTTFTCVNDAPAAIVDHPNQVWNVGATAILNPTVPLTASFTDDNGDAASSWKWTVITTPAGSAVSTDTLLDGTTASASFTADVAGIYVVQVEVCDRPGSCGTDVANITVERAIRELTDRVGGVDVPRVINATDRARGTSKIVLAGPDPASTTGGGKIWLYDLASDTEASASLDAVPEEVSVALNGTDYYAVAASNLWVWVVKFGSTGTAVTKLTQGNPATSVGSIALQPGSRLAFLFPKTAAAFYRFDYVNATASTPMVSTGYVGKLGRVDSGTNLFVIGASSLTRYSIDNQGNFSITPLAQASLPYPAFADLWVSQSSQVLFTSTGEIRNSSSLGTASTLKDRADTDPAAVTVQPTFVDSLPDGRVAAITAARVFQYGTGLGYAGEDALPQWGISGVGHAVAPDGVFLRADPADPTNKNIRHAVVHTTGVSPVRYGLVTFP